jgi:hypothetical protein
MSLRIAFDLDGVFADMDGELGRHAEALFATSPSTSDTEDGAQVEDEMIAPAPMRLSLSLGQQNRLWQHVRSLENFWEGLPELEPGALPRLANVAAERRWEVIFLTKRPATAGATAQVQTQRWLESKGFAGPSVYVVQGSRGLIASALALEVVVDDRPENCMDVVADSKAHAILVWRDDPAGAPAAARRLGIRVVGTVHECLDTLIQLDAGAPGKPRAMDRVMRLLGLREPAQQ